MASPERFVGQAGCEPMASVEKQPVMEATTTTAPAAQPLPEVLFIDDIAKVLRTSRSTIERRRSAGAFPIPELPALDWRPRWSRSAVEEYLRSTNGGTRRRAARHNRTH